MSLVHLLQNGHIIGATLTVAEGLGLPPQVRICTPALQGRGGGEEGKGR